MPSPSKIKDGGSGLWDKYTPHPECGAGNQWDIMPGLPGFWPRIEHICWPSGGGNDRIIN